MREFWVASGHHLTRRGDHGGLLATPELIMAYLARPELMPPDDACDAERDLHASLLADPLRAVTERRYRGAGRRRRARELDLHVEFPRPAGRRTSLEAVYGAGAQGRPTCRRSSCRSSAS